MTDTNKALLPCPFCGEQAKLWRDGKVSCTNTSCGCWRSHLQDNVVPFWADSWNTRAALSPNAVVIPRDKIKPYMLEHYKDWRDTDQEIDRHNEEGMTGLAEILVEALLSQYGEQK